MTTPTRVAGRRRSARRAATPGRPSVAASGNPSGPTGLSETRRRQVVLGVCCVSVLLVGVDSTAVNVALPSIGRDFHIDASALSWVIDAYTLVLATFLMLSASMADRFGRKRVFRIGLASFVLASGLCAIAPNLGWLLAFRALQGVGGSMLNPVAMAILSSVYPDRAQRARAIGVWAGVTGLALAIGPIAGGALLLSSWRLIFVMNVPIGLAAILIATKVIPESKAPKARRVDLTGQALIAAFLGTLVFGVIEGPDLGWTSPTILAVFAVSLLALAGFIFEENRCAEPLLDLGFLRSIPFSAANLIAVSSFASLSAFLYLNSIYLQDARGYSPLHTGILMLPVAIISILWGPRNGKILATCGSRIPLCLGGTALAAAAAILTKVSPSSPIPLLLVAYALIGLGMTSVGGPITHTAVAGMPPEQASVAAGVSSTTRQIGQTLGVALAGVTLASATHHTPAQLANATHPGWILNAGYGLAILTLGLLATTAYAKRSAHTALPGSAGPMAAPQRSPR